MRPNICTKVMIPKTHKSFYKRNDGLVVWFGLVWRIVWNHANQRSKKEWFSILYRMLWDRHCGGTSRRSIKYIYESMNWPTEIIFSKCCEWWAGFVVGKSNLMGLVYGFCSSHRWIGGRVRSILLLSIEIAHVHGFWFLATFNRLNNTHTHTNKYILSNIKCQMPFLTGPD